MTGSEVPSSVCLPGLVSGRPPSQRLPCLRLRVSNSWPLFMQIVKAGEIFVYVNAMGHFPVRLSLLQVLAQGLQESTRKSERASV